MVKSCSSYNCTQRYMKGISFHTFPKNPQYLKEWLRAVRRDKWSPSKHDVLCSNHFPEDCYEINGWSSKRTLKLDAIPSKFNFPVKKKKPTLKRKSPKKRTTERSERFDIPSLQTSQPLGEITNDMKNNIKKRRLYYPGDFKNFEANSLDAATFGQCIQVHKDTIEKKSFENKILKQKNRRLQKKVTDLTSLLDRIKSERLAFEETLFTVEAATSDPERSY